MGTQANLGNLPDSEMVPEAVEIQLEQNPPEAFQQLQKIDAKICGRLSVLLGLAGASVRFTSSPRLSTCFRSDRQGGLLSRVSFLSGTSAWLLLG